MVPAAVILKRSKTVSIVLLAVATIVVALLLPTSGRRRQVVEPPAFAGDPCAMNISGRLASTHVMVGDHEEHLVVTLRAPSCGERSTRVPMSVSIVLDRSGSMAPNTIPVEDQPLTHAKRAAIALIDQLQPTDAFSLVTYAYVGQLDIPMGLATADAKANARRVIDAITDDGGTNISHGLELGTAQLASTPVSGVRRIVLISDGDANEGVKSVDGLARIAGGIAQNGMSISSIGLGLDYNEKIMTAIAAAGRGNYYFVEDTAQLADMFTAELQAAGKTVAADAELLLKPAPGVEVLEVFGYGAHADGTTWSVPVADLTAGETRKIVARVRVRTEERGSMDLATAALTYRPIDAAQRTVVQAVARAEVTRDMRVVRAGIDTTTVRLVQEAETARAIEEASVVYERDGYAAATKVLDSRMQAAQAAATAAGDAGVAEGSLKVADKVKRDFSAAPPSAAGGRRATKGAGADAYQLAR
jgi:Ca-activated chloride channel homolog